MSGTRSLRGRLGLFTALIATTLSAVAALLVGVVRWQNDDTELADAVTLAAFELAEARDPEIPPLNVAPDGDAFAVLLGNPPDVIAQSGDLSDGIVAVLVDEVWQFTIDNGNAVTVDLDDFDAVVAGALCDDETVCDTAIVGVYRGGVVESLLAVWWWIVGVPLVAGLVAYASSRWLVGRSLAPVARMRRELDDITASDLDRRVPVPPTDDELGGLGRSMNATIGRLRDAVAANERFVADAAHELRSPITGARAVFEVNGARTDDDLLAAGLGELDRASRLIDDLLVLARRQAGPRRRSVVDVDVDDVARSLLASARLRYPDLAISGSLDPTRTRADPDDIHRVLANLLDNACRYASTSVQLRVGSAADAVVVTVDDDGPGIPVADRERVFERFARLDESRARSTGGSGLGLAIVRELVTDLGGAVSIGTSESGGASLRVSIPDAAPTV